MKNQSCGFLTRQGAENIEQPDLAGYLVTYELDKAYANHVMYNGRRLTNKKLTIGNYGCDIVARD